MTIVLEEEDDPSDDLSGLVQRLGAPGTVQCYGSDDCTHRREREHVASVRARGGAL